MEVRTKVSGNRESPALPTLSMMLPHTTSRNLAIHSAVSPSRINLARTLTYQPCWPQTSIWTNPHWPNSKNCCLQANSNVWEPEFKRTWEERPDRNCWISLMTCFDVNWVLEKWFFCWFVCFIVGIYMIKLNLRLSSSNAKINLKSS